MSNQINKKNNNKISYLQKINISEEKQIGNVVLESGDVVYVPIKEAGEKWSGKVSIKWDSPEDLFSKGSSQEISDEALKGHSGDVGKSIQALSFYINRAGKNLSSERKSVINKAKDILQKKLEK